LLRLIRVCTDDWPERDRLAMFRDNVGRDRVLVEPLPNHPFRIAGNMVKMPGLGLVSVRRSALRSHFADGGDRLIINLGAPALAVQAGREAVLEHGDAVALSEVGRFTTSAAGRIATVEFPDGGLARLLKDGGLRRIEARSSALRLLRRYLNAIWSDDMLSSFGLQQLAIAHVHDLAALAVGASREAEEIARGRGVRAARLLAVKSDILERLQGEFTLAEVAARHGVSARYVRMLFGSDGTSFSEFVREERLKRARSMLIARQFDSLRVSEIAYQVGFNDLSYFNRTFRRRFGVSPRELRQLDAPGLEVRPLSTFRS
jgi:AraC-like DNA-binding protein